MFDVFGNTIDHGPLLAGLARRGIHQRPPPLMQRPTQSEIFRTGTKAIDVLIHQAATNDFGVYQEGCIPILTKTSWPRRIFTMSDSSTCISSTKWRASPSRASGVFLGAGGHQHRPDNAAGAGECLVLPPAFGRAGRVHQLRNG